MELELGEAIEAAARAYLRKHAWGLRSTDDKLRAMAAERIREEVEAAAPIIEGQVREKIAQEIEAYQPTAHMAVCPPEIAWEAGRETAAWIARGHTQAGTAHGQTRQTSGTPQDAPAGGGS